jgi:hypothetical protein
MKVPISDYQLIDLEAPTLPAYSRKGAGGSLRWLVWCRHCHIWHYHGAGDGHREAHCEEPTPYLQSGYNLAYRGPWKDYFPGNP